MIILAIETSCDDTGIAILNDNNVIANVVFSQVDSFKKFGGIVPEIASRLHVDNIDPLIKEALSVSKLTLSDIDYIAFTQGPGLINTLQVGLIAAKTLSQYLKKPLVPIDHLEAHIFSPLIGEEYSIKLINKKRLGVIVSGGHTQFVEIGNNFKTKLLSTTRDDTIGEVYDKVSIMMGYHYPGGPRIDSFASKGKKDIKFKTTKLIDGDFSYSGLKSQVRRYIDENKNYNKYDLAFSFQKSAIDQLEFQFDNMVNKFNFEEILVSGGVSANSELRLRLGKKNYTVRFPEKKFSVDNAAMIGYLAYLKIKSGHKATFDLSYDSYPKAK